MRRTMLLTLAVLGAAILLWPNAAKAQRWGECGLFPPGLRLVVELVSDSTIVTARWDPDTTGPYAGTYRRYGGTWDEGRFWFIAGASDRWAFSPEEPDSFDIHAGGAVYRVAALISPGFLSLALPGGAIGEAWAVNADGFGGPGRELCINRFSWRGTLGSDYVCPRWPHNAQMTAVLVGDSAVFNVSWDPDGLGPPRWSIEAWETDGLDPADIDNDVYRHSLTGPSWIDDGHIRVTSQHDPEADRWAFAIGVPGSSPDCPYRVSWEGYWGATPVARISQGALRVRWR